MCAVADKATIGQHLEVAESDVHIRRTYSCTHVRSAPEEYLGTAQSEDGAPGGLELRAGVVGGPVEVVY